MLPSRAKTPEQTRYSPRPAVAEGITQPFVAGDSPSPSPSPGSESPNSRWVEFETEAVSTETDLLAHASRHENGVVLFN